MAERSAGRFFPSMQTSFGPAASAVGSLVTLPASLRWLATNASQGGRGALIAFRTDMLMAS